MTELEDIILKQDAEIERLQANISDNHIIMDCRKETIEELQEQLATRDEEIAHFRAERETATFLINMHISKEEGIYKQLVAKNIELARLREIAIDLKAVSYFVNFKSREQVFDLQPKEIQDKYRDRAAEELNLQVTQEAEYVERLERLALSMCLEAGWGQEEFEAALTKIREGK